MQAVRHNAGHEVDGKVHQRTMPGVLNLAQVLEFIEDRLHKRAFAQQHPVKLGVDDLFHVFAHPCDDIKPKVLHLLRKLFANVALVSVQLAKQARGDGQQALSVQSTLPAVTLMASNSPRWLITACSLKP